MENDARNGDIITHARAAWSSNPNEIGATEAVQLLAQMSNSSDTKRKEADALMKEMSKRIQSVSDVRFAEQVRRSEASHDERMAVINGVVDIAKAFLGRPKYKIKKWH